MVPYIKLLTSLAAGAAGGAVFHAAGLPLPWMLGPAFAVMLLGAVAPRYVRWPRNVGDIGVVIVAYVLGRTITGGMAVAIAHDLPWMALTALCWVLACIAVGLAFARLARIDAATAVLGCVPGGLTQMVLIADDMKQADAGTVAIIQTTRVIVILYTVPLLAAGIVADGSAAAGTAAEAAAAAVEAAAESAWPRYLGWLLLPLAPLAAWLLRKLSVPASEFLGPVLLVGVLSALGCPWPEVADPLLAAAQLLIGIYVGSRVQLRTVVSNRRLAPFALLMSVLLVGIALVSALLLAAVTNYSATTWFLSFAPGGLGEVAFTAIVLGADVAHVTAYQISRLLFVLLVAPPLIRRLIPLFSPSKS